MRMFGLRYLSIVAAALGTALFVGCENGGGGGSSSDGASDGTSSGETQLTTGRLTIAAGGTAQSSIVTAPSAGVVAADVSVPEDHVDITAWLENSDVPGSQYDRKTGAVLALSTTTASGAHWRMVVQNANATTLHANYTISHRP